MPLAPFHTLVGVKARNASRLLDGLDRLGIHDGRTRMKITALALAFSHPQRGEEAMPIPTQVPTPKMVEHGLPGREAAGQIAPGAPSAKQVENRIQDGAQGMGAWSATPGCCWQMALQTLPLGISQVAWIGSSHTVQCSPLCSYSALQDTLLEARCQGALGGAEAIVFGWPLWRVVDEVGDDLLKILL